VLPFYRPSSSAGENKSKRATEGNVADDNSAHVTNDASVISVTVDVHAPAHSSPAACSSQPDHRESPSSNLTRLSVSDLHKNTLKPAL